MKKYNLTSILLGSVMVCVALSGNVFGEYVKPCSDDFVKIQGPTVVISRQPQKREWIYSSGQSGQKIDIAIKIQQEKENKKQDTQASIVQKQEKENGGYFLISFGSPGLLNLFITFDYKSGENQIHTKTNTNVLCTKKILVNVYNKSILYRQEYEKNIDKKLLENILQHNILFHVKKLQEEKESEKDNEIIQVSDFLFFDLESPKDIFRKLQKREGKDDFKNKKIFLITQKDKELEKKTLMPFVVANNKKNIYLINTKEFKDYLVDLALGKMEIEKQLLNTPLTLQPGGKGVTKVVNILVYHGITKETLGFLLMLFVVVCLLIFCKHVIGIPCYGLYYPIIGAIGILLVGAKTSIIVLGSSIISYIMTRFVAKKMMLLVYGKISIYILLSLLFFMGIQTILFTNFSHNTTLLFQETNGGVWAIGVLCIILSVRKVFGESYNPRRIKRWIHILWFSILAYGISQILTNAKYQETLLLYPRIIFIVFIITIILGTYAQLQLVEIFRFWPLIRKKIYKKQK